jgi:hypothetical protein
MKRMNVSAIRDVNVVDATINAEMIYEKFEFAAKANAMLERVAHRAGESTYWSVKPWRVDMLKLASGAKAALAEAAEAHLILLALLQVQSHFPWLVEWLERWARCRQVQEAALAVWDDGSAGTRLARTTFELSQFAERHGLSLIFDDNELVEEKSSRFASDLHKRAVSSTPTLGGSELGIFRVGRGCIQG